MSLVTVIKDYIEIVHKIIETNPGYIFQHENYTDLTTLYFYIVNIVKHFFTDILSLELFEKIVAFPIIVPSIANSMISEISVLDGTFHNIFTFLDTPLENAFSSKNDFIIIICLEKFFIGLINSLFLWLPTSAATFLCLRRFIMQGMEIGYIAAIGTMTANIFWLICVLFGVRWIVIPWMSLDILRYWLGFMLLIKYFWDNRLPAKEIKSDLSLNVIKNKLGLNSLIAIFTQSFQLHRNFSNPIQQIFLFHFLLAFTEQTSIYPFLSHFSLSPQSTYLESFPSNNLINFILIHSFYLLGIFIGSFSFINFICWFWEEPAYKVYLWATKNFQKIRVSDMVRITHFIFQTLTISLACASLPYFSIEYFITKPLGFLPNDKVFHQSQNTSFLTHSTSPVLYRSPYYFPRQRFFRYDDWAEYYGKNIPLDTSLYDQGAYRLYPIEDLHYGADYEWTRRRSNHVKIRSRMKRIIWFPRNWATQIWDLAKTWSRRNVAWRNEILSQYQNNWDSKSAPFWEQIVREELVFEKEKSYFQNERKRNSPWAASRNWSQKFLTSGEGFWWNWWSKNTISDNKIWWNWILTKKPSKLFHVDPNNNQQKDIIFSNYQKLPTTYRLDYWLPQERLISLYSEQSKIQKNKLNLEIATLRKFIRKINKRIQINSLHPHSAFSSFQFINSTKINPLSKHTIFSIKNAELYYKKYVFSNSIRSFINNFKNIFYSNQNYLLNSQTHKNISLIDSNKILNSLLNGYSLANQSSLFSKWNNISIIQSPNASMHLQSKYLGLRPTLNSIKQTIPIVSEKENFFINNFTNKSLLSSLRSTSLFLTLPAQYYLHKEKSFSRKLDFYGVRASRQFKPLNNSPIFNFYMKTYFHQYKPTRLYIANTKMKRDLGAGGRNRFKSRQYANKQLKKSRILSKTPWIRQWVSQSGFLTRRKRLESWIRYAHYNSNEIWAFIMKADIDNFIKRQPNSHFLTNNEERLLHLRRFLLGEHYETLRWYSYMQHYRSMKTKIGGTKSFANRIYNQQFKGTFHKVRHLFALTPSLNGGGILAFDQPLYNEFSNDIQNNIFNKELIHEELLGDTKTNLNSFLIQENTNLNFHLDFNDLIMKSSQIIKEYILEITPIRQKQIHKFLKDKNYVDLTNFLWSGQRTPIVLSNKNKNNFLIQDLILPFSIQSNLPLSKIKKDFKIHHNSIRSSFSIDQQKKLQSILIFMFHRRRSLAKDYKRGSERLWKKWRKKYLIQKQISKQKNPFVTNELRGNQLEVNIEKLAKAKDKHFIPLILNNRVTQNLNKNIKELKQNQTLPIFKNTNQIYKTPLYSKNENKETLFSYQTQTAIRKALKDSIAIQIPLHPIHKNLLSKYPSRQNFIISLNARSRNENNKYINFDNKLHNQQKDGRNWHIDKVFGFKKDNLYFKLLKADKIAIKELINTVYKKRPIFYKIQFKYLTLNYWFKKIINIFQYERNILNSDKNQYKWNIQIDNNKNKQDSTRSITIMNFLSYLQNRTIRERLEINKKILTMKNYNQIDNKFSLIRASRHFKRARTSQRKKLSQHIQKYRNFFHLETQNLKKTNIFNIYQGLDSFLFNKLPPDSIILLSKMNSTSSTKSLDPFLSVDFKNHKISNKINNLIESYKIDSIRENQINSTFQYVRHSTIFDKLQIFLESLYYLPRFSTLWQSNLINSHSNLKSRIDMGSVYETKQNWTPIGTNKELFRQNFNTKNKIQDNIKRKLLDNHLNRFSERRRWNNQYQTINLEINEQLKKLLEMVKENKNNVFSNQKLLNLNKTVLDSNVKIQPIEIQHDNKFYLNSKDQKPQFFSLGFQKSILSLNSKEIDQSKLLDLIINQKNKSRLPTSTQLISSLQFNSFFNEFNNVERSELHLNLKSSNFISNLNSINTQFKNAYYFKIKELIMKERNQFGNNFKKKFFYDNLLNYLILSSNSEIQKEQINQNKIFLKIINHLQINSSIKKINKNWNKELSLSKSFEAYLITNFKQKIENQLQKLETQSIELKKITKDEFQNKDNNSINDESKIELPLIEKQNKIITTQKRLITKRIDFLQNLNQKLKIFENWYLTLPIDSKTNPIFNNEWRETEFIKENNSGLKSIKKQYYFSKKFFNLFIANCKNFIQYLKKEDERGELEKQNKIFSDFLQPYFTISSKKTIKEEITKKSSFVPPIKNTLELKENITIQKLLKKPIIELNNGIKWNSNKIFEKNTKFLKSQQSENKLSLSVDSSIIQMLLKKQKFANFDEILGSLLSIQKRGNILSQKNIYYKKLKNEWNTNKFSNVSNWRNQKFISSLKTRNGIRNFMAVRTWTKLEQSSEDTPIIQLSNPRVFEDKDSLTYTQFPSFEKKRTRSNLLTVENFIKESILKPQRFEKQQSRKRLKFKKLPRQEHFQNLQIWENYFKQKEDVKNKQFFDDLSQSFQKWANFAFFPQKRSFQKQILNSANFLPFSTYNYKERNKKINQFTNFYDKNFQTITNLDIIKQIEHDHLIQKELNLFFTQNRALNQKNNNFINNEQILQISDKDTKPLASFGAIHIRNFDSFDQVDSKENQEQTNYLDKDTINKIYSRFFVKSIEIPINKSKINQKFLIGLNTFPFYAGWDESLRKFVITNRLLSRRDAGYETNSNLLFKKKENNFQIEFTQWPLQGRNAATTFFCHFPFISQPSDFSETIQYKSRTQLQQEEINKDVEYNEVKKKDSNNSNPILEKNTKFPVKRIKKQKQELRNENRRNITNLIGPNEIQNRRKALFYPLKWKNLKSNPRKVILKFPLNLGIRPTSASNYRKFQKMDSLYISSDNSFFNILKKEDLNYFKPLLSKLHLLRILRKGNTAKIRLPKLRPYKKYIKKENDILESSWRTFLSKRKLRSYNFVRQKNIRTMHLFKSQLGEKLKWTKMQWLFRKNNSRANRQSENRKNKSGAHYLRPRKKSFRRRSLGIQYKQNKPIWSLNNVERSEFNHSNLIMEQNEANISQRNTISKQMLDSTLFHPIISSKKMNKNILTDFSNLSSSNFQSYIRKEHNQNLKQNAFYEIPYNWIQPNNSINFYNTLFKTSSIYTPIIYSILPGHGRLIPKMQTMPLPKSYVQTIKRAIRLANFEPASFIQREILSYEWSMKQLIKNMTNRLNNSANRIILKYRKNSDNLKQNLIEQNDNSNSSVSIDLLIQRHLHLFKKKLIQNPVISASSNSYLSQFSRQRSFQKRSIRLRKFNMTLAMNLYDRWFFYYYTGGREDPLQNLFQSFEKLAQNISSPNIIKNSEERSEQSNILDYDAKRHTIDNLENLQNNLIFKSVRKFLTQKPDQKRSFNTFLINLKTKKSSPSSQTQEISNEYKKNEVNSKNLQLDYLKNPNTDLTEDYSINQRWHFFRLFPHTHDGKSAQKEMLDKLSSNKTQKKQQEKDLEEDRFYFLKANRSPIIQDFRSSNNVNRHHPLNGGFIWPGDYLRLETIMLPKNKKQKYFYNKSLVSEIQNGAKMDSANLQIYKSTINSNSKINGKMQEFRNFVLESK